MKKIEAKIVLKNMETRLREDGELWDDEEKAIDVALAAIDYQIDTPSAAYQVHTMMQANARYMESIKTLVITRCLEALTKALAEEITL